MTAELITIARAAERLDVSTRTVRRWIADGILAGYRVGPRLIRLDIAEVDALGRRIPTTVTADVGRAVELVRQLNVVLAARRDGPPDVAASP